MRPIKTSLLFSLLCLFFLLMLATHPALHVHAEQHENNNNNSNNNFPIDFLNESSVVLITGMAGFIGSELAMALHRVYSPKKIIGIDSMDDGFGDASSSCSSNGSGSRPCHRSPEELGVFDYQRQRLFHVLQTVQEKCHFYRVDFRPNIPDYQDRGQVPVLDHIFASHPDITHVVHLADPYGPPSLAEEGQDDILLTRRQAVPRKKEQIKAGMMEALLEQLYKAGKMTGRVPHFVYASSSHVYNHYNVPTQDDHNPNPPPFAEHKPITSPSSIHGASKLLDEILAQTYHETRGIYSVGLRFFDVYGPWSSPGSLLFDLAERAVRGGDFVTEVEERILDKATRDFVYIEDAVDAIMAAMQFRPGFMMTGEQSTGKKQTAAASPRPVVINVGTGQGNTVRTIIEIMQQHLSTTVSSKLPPKSTSSLVPKQSISYASTTRAKQLLGFEARFSLQEGVLSLLAWHHDRAFPYGSVDQSNLPLGMPHHPMEFKGIVACSPLDTECLKGAPVFPCASECSHRNQCTPSFYDSVLETTRQWTAYCPAVLYTVDLDEELTAIPSATAAVSTTSQSHVINNNDNHDADDQHCNLAFVSSASPLVKDLTLQQHNGGNVAAGTNSKPLKHGFWTLLLVDVKGDEIDFFLEFLPKLSPGLFFGGEATKRVIYVEPNVIIDSIPNLLAEASMQPLYQQHKDDDGKNRGGNDKDQTTKEGATAMLIGKGRQSQSSRKGMNPLQEAVQDSAYRSVRIGVIDQMSGDGFAQALDTSFIVHTLQSEDSRLFRCDVFGELMQWEVGTDQSAFEFVLELHDMWSSVIVRKAGLGNPWWVGEDVVTIPERTTLNNFQEASSPKRRLIEALAVQDADHASGSVKEPNAAESDAAENNGGGAVILRVRSKDEDPHDNADQAANPGDSRTDADNAATAKRNANFGDGDDQVNGDEHGPDDGAAVIAARNDEDKEDDGVIDDDTTKEDEEEAGIPSRPEVHSKDERDVSLYDTWMGVLSSTAIQYFVRIVPSSEAGVVVLDEYDLY